MKNASPARLRGWSPARLRGMVAGMVAGTVARHGCADGHRHGCAAWSPAWMRGTVAGTVGATLVVARTTARRAQGEMAYPRVRATARVAPTVVRPVSVHRSPKGANKSNCTTLRCSAPHPRLYMSAPLSVDVNMPEVSGIIYYISKTHSEISQKHTVRYLKNTKRCFVGGRNITIFAPDNQHQKAYGLLTQNS